jgi:hypothetical protein
VLGGALMAATQHVGIPFGQMTGELARRFHFPIGSPAAQRRCDAARAVADAVGAHSAALILALRIRRLVPVDALRIGA